ncbi:MAG TPA: Na/Pi cotransporter family protein [Verrucomicrobiae bacterium]|nr:Na/Pi cotransporter family protein [Verrucomicrobiae bacterium]
MGAAQLHQPFAAARRGRSPVISGSEIFLNLLGAAALLVWGLRMVRTGVLRAFGGELRGRLGRSMNHRLTAFGTGVGITLLLQSSMATAMMAASFASRGVVAAAPALAIMLGADLGTSLVAQAYAHHLPSLSPILILAGVIAFLGTQSTRWRDLGRAGIGLGLVLLALQLISANADPIRESPVIVSLIPTLEGTSIPGVIIGAVLAVLSTSSLAIVLLTVSLAKAGVLPIMTAIAFVLGANLGSAITPVMATLRGAPEARRVPLGNMIFRCTGVAVALVALPWILPELARLTDAPAHQVLNFHTALNLAIAIIFLPLIGPVAKLCLRILPDRPLQENPGRPRYLDARALESPAVAIANAARETLRLGDIVERMLTQTLDVIRDDDRKLLKEVEELDNSVDALHEAIKLYLTKVSRETLDTQDNQRLIDVITFTTNLEHIGDIVDKNLLELANKKIRNKLQFSSQGFAEICGMHTRLLENLRLALNVFMSGDVKLARQLLEQKVAFRDLERAAAEAHLARLRVGTPESLETTSLHLDILRDLKRINSHLTSVAYPILDAAGELVQSRLRTPATGAK